MELEPGRELEPADELRQVQISGPWKLADRKLAPWGWWGWSVGWPRAKTVMMEVERAVQQFAVSWPEAWARAEVRA